MNKSNPNIKVFGREVGFVYVLAIAGHYKIGKSCNVDAVVTQAGRFDRSSRLLTCWPSPDYSKEEAYLHESLKAWRLEGEQFDIPSDALRWIVSLDDDEFSAWLGDTNGSSELIGHHFPRIRTPDGLRGWKCHFYPSSNTLAKACVVQREKPDYSTVERLYLQDDRGFRSVLYGGVVNLGGGQ